MVEIPAILDRSLDGEPVGYISLSRPEHELIDRLVRASDTEMPGRYNPCGDHQAVASGLTAQLAEQREAVAAYRNHYGENSSALAGTRRRLESMLARR